MRIYKARQTSSYEDAKNVWEKIKPVIEVYKRMGYNPYKSRVKSQPIPLRK